MESVSSDPTSLTTSKLKPQNQVNTQVRVDSVIGKKGVRRKRGHILHTESSSSSEPTLYHTVRGEGPCLPVPGLERAEPPLTPGDTSLSSPCPAHTHFIIAAAAAWASWVFHQLWLP